MKSSELANYNDVINTARTMWKRSAQDHYERYGDVGSCVLGAGIYVEVYNEDSKVTEDVMLIRANEVSKCQGSLHWEYNIDDVIQFLRANGIHALYEWGMLD